MLKLFSLEEANRLIPTLEGVLEELQRGIKDSLALRQKLSQLSPISLEARNIMQELQFLFYQINDAKRRLDQMGIFLKDLEQGLIDIPSQLGAEVVYLTYEKGKEAFTHYHRLNEGTALPLPIDTKGQKHFQL